MEKLQFVEVKEMWFWWFMFICNLIIPILFIVVGWMMWKHCPKKINGIVGYRTKRSMQNLDTWKFAHNYCGQLWWKLGWIILIPTIVVQIPFYRSNTNTIGIVGGIVVFIQCLLLISSIIPTEKALKKQFPSIA